MLHRDVPAKEHGFGRRCTCVPTCCIFVWLTRKQLSKHAISQHQKHLACDLNLNRPACMHRKLNYESKQAVKDRMLSVQCTNDYTVSKHTVPYQPTDTLQTPTLYQNPTPCHLYYTVWPTADMTLEESAHFNLPYLHTSQQSCRRYVTKWNVQMCQHHLELEDATFSVTRQARKEGKKTTQLGHSM